MEEIMLKIDNVSKQYKLGQIGGTTLREELQRKHALRHGKEDPTQKIGAKEYKNGETFMALNGVSFEVKKGERVGIIGHNGAGKSTLLKLISRVTAPTDGAIYMNGRVTSMLEVGTGFSGELTGRENIYMNGAILGMTKKEIDAKIEDIIEFSEVRQFIDTPVKRYSSGMYVKLAFAVAAYLNSEIMIMDEVLAVGDMAFQKKCLDKMNDVSRSEGRTILYVSHNMNTIRQLCERVVVMDHGQVVFDGDVDSGVALYLDKGYSEDTLRRHYDYPEFYHSNKHATNKVTIHSLDVLHYKGAHYQTGDDLSFSINYDAVDNLDVMFRCVFETKSNEIIGTMLMPHTIHIEKGTNQKMIVTIRLNHFVAGVFRCSIICFTKNQFGGEQVVDGVYPAFVLPVDAIVNNQNPIEWKPQYWGYTRLEDILIEQGV